MKKLAAQALAFQYQLQIENAQAVLNNNHAALNLVDQALHEVITANEKYGTKLANLHLYLTKIIETSNDKIIIFSQRDAVLKKVDEALSDNDTNNKSPKN